MLRADPAVIAADRRLRASPLPFALALAAFLLGAPFVLPGCNVPAVGSLNNLVRNLEVDFDGSTGTLSGEGEATGLPGSVEDGAVVGVVAAAGVLPSPPVVTQNGDEIPIVASDPGTAAVIAAELEAAGVYTPGDEQVFVFETVGDLTIANGDAFTFSVQQLPLGPLTTTNRLGGGGMLRSDLLDGPPYLTFQAVDDPVAFQPGASPDLKPDGAVAWKTLNSDLFPAHSDGPFALPGQPNPLGLPVLDPADILSIGPHWAGPDACRYVHAHGFYNGPPGTPHGDPQGPVCGHGALVYLPHVTGSLVSPPDGAAVVAGGHVTLTASADTTGFGVARVEYVVGGAHVGTATAEPWAIVYAPPAVTVTASEPWFARVVDHNGATATSEIFYLTHVAPLELSVSPPPSVVVGGLDAVTVTAFLQGGLPPLSVDLEIDDVIVDSQTGSSPFSLSYLPGSVTGTASYPFVLRVIGRDSVTSTASPDFDLLVVPQIGGSFSLANRAVVAGDPLTWTADLSGYPPFEVTLHVDDVPVETLVGAGPIFSSSFSAPTSTATVEYLLSVSARDSVPQSVTLTALPLTAVGTLAPPYLQISAPPAGIEVLEGSVVTITASVVGGVGGVSSVDFTGNGEPIGSDANPGDGFSILWVANPMVGGGGVATPTATISLRAAGADALGQGGLSDPVDIFVDFASEIPALGGAALGALALLLAGVGVHAALRRRR